MSIPMSYMTYDDHKPSYKVFAEHRNYIPLLGSVKWYTVNSSLQCRWNDWKVNIWRNSIIALKIGCCRVTNIKDIFYGEITLTIKIRHGWVVKPCKSAGCNYPSIPKQKRRFSEAAVVMTWMSNSISHKTMDIIDHPCPNLSWYIFDSDFSLGQDCSDEKNDNRWNICLNGNIRI